MMASLCKELEVSIVLYPIDKVRAVCCAAAWMINKSSEEAARTRSIILSPTTLLYYTLARSPMLLLVEFRAYLYISIPEIHAVWFVLSGD